MSDGVAAARRVIVLTRAPSAQGKTRLTADLPGEQARALREALLLDTVDVVRGAGVPFTVSFTPESAREEIATLIPDAILSPQRGDDLGERMRHAVNEQIGNGARAVVLIGSDLPCLPSEHIRDAFTMLDEADLVIGPSDDGGFYLIGASCEMRDVFHGVDWQGEHVASEVVRAALEFDLMVGFVREWWDVDRPEDLQRVLTKSAASAPGASCDRVSARRVREYLERDS